MITDSYPANAMLLWPASIFPKEQNLAMKCNDLGAMKIHHNCLLLQKQIYTIRSISPKFPIANKVEKNTVTKVQLPPAYTIR